VPLRGDFFVSGPGSSDCLRCVPKSASLSSTLQCGRPVQPGYEPLGKDNSHAQCQGKITQRHPTITLGAGIANGQFGARSQYCDKENQSPGWIKQAAFQFTWRYELRHQHGHITDGNEEANRDVRDIRTGCCANDRGKRHSYGTPQPCNYQEP
jgi:hypothetical protein